MAGKNSKIKASTAPAQDVRVENSENVSVTQNIDQHRETKNYRVKISPGLVAGLIVVALLGVTGIFYLIWGTLYALAPMGGNLNILVVPFVEKNFGVYSQNDLGRNIAQTFSEELSASEQANTAGLKFRVLGPSDKAPSIWGFSEGDLDQSAQNLSEQLNAQIVIYGVLTTDEYGDHLASVRFYISPTNFGDAQELIGSASLGELEIGSFRIVGNTVSGDDLLAQNKEMRERVQIFSLLIKGLGAFIGQDFGTAGKYFDQAGDPALWSNANGLEVVYLLSGNLALRHARELLDANQLDDALHMADQAADFFDQASKTCAANGKGTYARSFLGLAGVESFRAIAKARAANDVKIIDAQALQRQEEYLRKALTADYRPESADIPEKVAYSRAQLALAHYQLDPKPAYLQGAKSNYQAVVDSYKKGNKRLIELAALSDAGLANVAWIERDYKTAVDRFLAAFETTRVPALKAQVLVNIGRIYDAQKNTEKALKYYQDALERRSDLQKVMSAQEIAQVEQRIKQLHTGGNP